MKKILALGLAFLLAAGLTACGGNTPSGGGDNTAPSISGAADQTVTAGSSFDALAGVTATDKEDGDLTSMITVEASPALNFQNGKATPDTAGSYELVYRVADKGGLTAEAYATLTVTKQTGEEVVYKTFDFGSPEVTDTHGWEFRKGDSADAEAALKEGAYVITVANPGEGDGDVVLAKPGFTLQAADYRVRIWAKSTKDTYAHILARNENAEGWETFGGAFNVRITEEIQPLDLFFTSPGEGSAELLFHLGRITPNPENAADTTPEDFTVTIDKIELYEISGEETLTAVYTADFAAADAVTIEAGDGADASASVEGGAGQFVIASYPTEGGVWSIKANIGLGGQSITEGQKYYYRVVLNAENGQGGECLVESAAQYDQCRVNFDGLSLPAGEDTEIRGTFTADRDIADPVIRLQIGNAPDGVTANTITVKEVEFGLVEGDKETHKTIESFMPFGRGSANADNTDFPWETFNGTDEDNERGVGTIWAENGSFFYRIDNAGTVDWHNKLVCGYTGNPLTLAADSYYIVEITAKADKPISCGFFLNPMGSWDPRISEGMDLTTDFQTFRFTTTDTFVVDMDFEMLFQFGSEAAAALGSVTIEFQNITIYQMPVM